MTVGEDTHRPMAAELMRHAATVFRLSPAAQAVLTELLARCVRPDGTAPIAIRELIAAQLRAADAATIAAIDPTGPLVTQALVTVTGDGAWLDRTIVVADQFWPRFMGHWPAAVPRARARRPGALDALTRPAETISRLAAAARSVRNGGVVLVQGRAGTGRGTVARAVADAAASAVLELAASDVERDPRMVVREARWQQAAVVVDDLDLVPGQLVGQLGGAGVPVVGTWAASAPVPVGVVTVELPRWTLEQRAAAWRGHLSAADLGDHDIDLLALAAQHRVGPGTIELIVRALRGVTPADLGAALRQACRDLSSANAWTCRVAVDAPTVELAAPALVRRDLELIVAWAHRQRRAPTERGLTCLFFGAPGTGKTLAAVTVARRAGLELLRVDLAQVIDKYVGETEKRLEQVFSTAADAGAALLFDEADALFGRRAEVRDARDRYANIETSFLLQRIEQHSGLVMLTSNFAQAIDAAFHRRFGFVVEFKRPGPHERRRLWTAHLRSGAIGDADLDFLAARFELSGGDIVNAVFVAELLAERDGAPLAMRHLVIGCWRELLKAGRLVDGHDLQPWWPTIEAYLKEAGSA